MTEIAEVDGSVELPEAKFDFDEDFQDKAVYAFMKDARFARRMRGVIDPGYFEKEASAVLVKLTSDFVETYKTAPDPASMVNLVKDALNAKRIREDLMPEIREMIRSAYTTEIKNVDYVADQVAKFAKDKAVEQVIIKSVDLHAKRDYAKIAELMKEAIRVGEEDGNGDYDYWGEVDNRTEVRKAIASGAITRDGISSGVKEVDAQLYHYGWGRRELSCLMGPSKSGKSAFMGIFAANASKLGYNVLYVSLEVDKGIISDRLDAAISDTKVRELHVHADDVNTGIKAAAAKSGRFMMRDFASGTLKVSTLHALLERMRGDGINFDLVVVDYADIMAPEDKKTDLQDGLRQIYIDLRALAFDFNCAVLTATQTNREGAKQHTARATDVGDDWNKTRTVDVMIGINATEAEKATGESRLVWLLSRNSASGVSVRVSQNREKMQFLNKVVEVITP